MKERKGQRPPREIQPVAVSSAAGAPPPADGPRRKSGIGRRAFGAILLFSFALTLITAVLEFALEYQAKSDALSAELDRAIRAQTPAIVTAEWNMDMQELKVLVEGMRNFAYVSYSSVVGTPGLSYSSGTPRPVGRTLRSPLVHMGAAGSTEIGYLDVQLDTDRMVSDLVLQIRDSLAFWIFILLFESLFIVLLFRRMVTVHLVKAAAHFRSLDEASLDRPLVLAKKRHGDELDILVEAFNDMGRRLADFSERKDRALVELRESEERNRSLVENAPDAILIYDPAMRRYVDCNLQAELLFGRPKVAILESTPSDLYPPSSTESAPSAAEIEENIARVEAGESLSFRRPVRGKGDSIVQCEVRVTPFTLGGRRLQRSSYLDISERLKAEDALRKSLGEKEVLLQEVYHRTKNNMQVIASLLEMKAEETRDDESRIMLKEMVGRIVSMSLVHEKLYRSKDLSRIDLGEYLQALVDNIRSAFIHEGQGRTVSLETEPGIVALFDVAVPCGLVVDELVVNALRHGLPPGRDGRVAVHLRRPEPGWLQIVVSDDGVGFPPGFDYRENGRMGIQVVLSLIEFQLHGKVEVEAERGTRWTLSFRDDLYETRL